MFADRYEALAAAARPTTDEAAAFDAHVIACVLAAALGEVAAGGSATDATGLSRAVLAGLLAEHFPAAPPAAFRLEAAAEPVVEMEEELLRDLLRAHAAPVPTAQVMATVVARRALRDDHLWQDLGLHDRGELNRLLARHFPRLHAGNTANMRWKKYFYRRLCEAEGFTLCTAPTCGACADFDACFGAEDGESRFAQMTRAAAQAAPGA